MYVLWITISYFLSFILQDPEVVMAPLPLFHRPLSQDNSRETSLSSGRGGGRSTGPDTSHSGGSGSGVSLPMRGQTGVKTPNTPDTPSASTVISGSIPNAASSDYLIPLTGNMARPKNIKTHHRQSVTSHATTGTPVSSPSDEPASEESDEGSNQDETSSGRTRDSRWMSYEPAAILNQNHAYIPHIIG